MIQKLSQNIYKFFNTDCLVGMKDVQQKSVDIVVTSPPYNIGIGYRSYNDSLSTKDYLEWSDSWAKEVHRLLKDDGSFFLNIGAPPSNPMLPHEIAIRFSKYFHIQNTFHWVKSISIETKEGELISTGHFKPINSQRYVSDCHEYVFHFTKSGNTPLHRLNIGVPYKDKSNINRWKHTNGRDKRCRGNTWFIPYKTIHNKKLQRPHPATFPVQLAKHCILLHGIDRETVVMDPFLGLGSSAIAALECNVGCFLGYDIELEYLEYAIDALTDKRNFKLSYDLIKSKEICNKAV